MHITRVEAVLYVIMIAAIAALWWLSQPARMAHLDQTKAQRICAGISHTNCTEAP